MFSFLIHFLNLNLDIILYLKNHYYFQAEDLLQ